MLTIADKPIGFETWSLINIPSTDAWHDELQEIRKLGIGMIEISAPCSRDEVQQCKGALDRLYRKCKELSLNILGWHAPALAKDIGLEEQINPITEMCSLLKTSSVTIMDWSSRETKRSSQIFKDYAQRLMEVATALNPTNAAEILDPIHVDFHVFAFHLKQAENKKGHVDDLSKTELDILLDYTDNKIGIQLDTFWLAKAGYLSPESFFNEYSLEDRHLSIHLGNKKGKLSCALGDKTGEVNCTAWLDFIKENDSVKNVVLEFMPGTLHSSKTAPNPVLVKSINWLKKHGAVII